MKLDRKAMEQKNLPDWTIGELYNQAWEILKNHKVLLLFSMMLIGGTSSDYVTVLSVMQNVIHHAPDTSHEVNRVLGASTNIYSDAISYLFSTVPFSLYLLLGLELLI